MFFFQKQISSLYEFTGYLSGNNITIEKQVIRSYGRSTCFMNPSWSMLLSILQATLTGTHHPSAKSVDPTMVWCRTSWSNVFCRLKAIDGVINLVSWKIRILLTETDLQQKWRVMLSFNCSWQWYLMLM